MRATTLQRRSTTKHITQTHVHDLGSKYGLALVGDERSPFREVREVAWLVEDWKHLFNERAVSWRTLVVALAGDDALRDLELTEDVYMSKEHYEYAAEWQMSFVLNHLDGSGLSIVRMPTP